MTHSKRTSECYFCTWVELIRFINAVHAIIMAEETINGAKSRPKFLGFETSNKCVLYRELNYTFSLFRGHQRQRC